MQHGTFLFTLACKPTLSTPPNTHTHTHTHTPLASPFPTFVSVERHMVTAIRFPSAESAFHFTAVHKEVRPRQTEILCESSLFFVCAWAKRCERHKNSQGERERERERERESLIKLHLVKQTSLHSSRRSGRIYAALNKERHLRELTENQPRTLSAIHHSLSADRPVSIQVDLRRLRQESGRLER